MDHENIHTVQEAFYQSPTFWVAVAFVVFMALALRPVARAIIKMLDNRSSQIAADIAQARRLRDEAQEVLASYQKKQRESLQEAEDMLASTAADAARIIEKAEADLKLSIEKRLRQATDKIAQAEARAIADVQNYVADVSLVAAQKLLTEYLDKGGNDELVRKATADVATKIH